MLILQCRSCGRRLGSPDGATATKGRCPECGEVLPIEEGSQAVFESNTKAQAPGDRDRVDRSGKLLKILIIDEFDHGEIMGPALATQMDCRAWNTRSGGKGLEFARRIVPDVIITGYRLADMEAAAFYEKLRADEGTKNIPLVAWSMLGKPDEFFELGAAWYFSKPYRVEKVMQVVRKIVEGGAEALREEFGKKLERTGAFHHNAWHSYP